MDMAWLKEKAKEYLDKLCNQIPNRSAGSEGNQLATNFFTKTIKSFGFTVDRQSNGAVIAIDGE